MLRVFTLGLKAAATVLPATSNAASSNGSFIRCKSFLHQVPKPPTSTTRPQHPPPATSTSEKTRITTSKSEHEAVLIPATTEEEVEQEDDESEEPIHAKDWDIVTESLFSYPSGRPWRDPPLSPLRKSSGRRGPGTPTQQEQGHSEESGLTSASVDQQPSRAALLYTIQTTQDTEKAWNAYQTLRERLTTLTPNPQTHARFRYIPYAHLHRLSRLFSRVRPKTRKNFLRHVSVLLTLHQNGGKLHLHEWNAILHAAGSGWRKGNKEDYLNSLGVFMDLIEGRSPATTFLSGKQDTLDLDSLTPSFISSALAAPPASSPDPNDPTANPLPDIYSYTTLVSAAARSHDTASFQHALQLFRTSGLRPNRVTHLCLLRFYADAKSLAGVRAVLQQMISHGHALGIDGLNAALWAYAQCDLVDCIPLAYRLLRANIPNLSAQHIVFEKERDQEGWNERARQSLKHRYKLVVDPHVRPNKITYCLVSQILAHYGDLTGALTVLTDMLLATNCEVGAPVRYPRDGKLRIGVEEGDMESEKLFAKYQPNIVMFRGLFLGFARHAVSAHPRADDLEPSKNPFITRLSRDFFASSNSRSVLYQDVPPAQWSLKNLELIFEQFLALPLDHKSSDGVEENDGEEREHVVLTPSVWYWIMVAFGRTSGYDLALMREAWVALEERFGPPRTGVNGRLHRLRRRLFA